MHCILRVFGHKEPTPHARKYGQIVTVMFWGKIRLGPLLWYLCPATVLQLLSCIGY